MSVLPFGRQAQEYKISELIEEASSFGHGGGDYGLIRAFYEVLTGSAQADTALERSVESHLIALAAEQSRKSGRVVALHEDDRKEKRS